MSALLHSGLLADVSVALAVVGQPPVADIAQGLSELGARVERLPAPDSGVALGRIEGQPGALIFDCSGWVADPGPGEPGVAPLQELLDQLWVATEAVANRALIPSGAGGRIVYLAPAHRARTTAGAARAALENLSRTLSVEWARHGITACTVAPAAETRPEDLVTVTAYLLSEAGAFCSGTLLELDSLPG